MIGAYWTRHAPIGFCSAHHEEAYRLQRAVTAKDNARRDFRAKQITWGRRKQRDLEAYERALKRTRKGPK